MKNNDQKCFLWCHVGHINPVKIHPESITQTDKELANDLDYDGFEFPVREKDFSKIETKTIFALMRIVMKKADFSNLHFRLKI